MIFWNIPKDFVNRGICSRYIVFERLLHVVEYFLLSLDILGSFVLNMHVFDSFMLLFFLKLLVLIFCRKIGHDVLKVIRVTWIQYFWLLLNNDLAFFIFFCLSFLDFGIILSKLLRLLCKVLKSMLVRLLSCQQCVLLGGFILISDLLEARDSLDH